LSTKEVAIPIDRATFGRLASGREFSAYTLRAGEFSALVTEYGATLLSLFMPASQGRRVDILLGVDSAARLFSNTAYFGSTIGRVAGRISGAAFRMNGKPFLLMANENRNHLHGGLAGFDKRLWSAAIDDEGENPSVRFSRVSPDGEEGYPGRLDVELRYSLSAEGHLEMAYEAHAETDTIISLTNHAYFNLSDDGDASILGQRLQLASSRYLVTRPDLTLSGEIADVEGSPLDFRTGKLIGRDLESIESQPGVRGYDHCCIIERAEAGPVPFARLEEPRSGRAIRLATTLPAVQLYSGNFLGGAAGKGGRIYSAYAGLCLETQMYPDAVNHPDFPSMLLRAGEAWKHRTVVFLES